MTVQRLAALILLASGCAGGPTRPAWRDPAPAASPSAGGRALGASFAPGGEPAARYGDAAPAAPSSPLLDEVARRVDAIAAETGRAAPRADGRLYAVAAEMAGLLADAPPPYEAVEFALSHHGIVEPSPHLLVLRLRDGDVEGLLGQLGDRLPDLFRHIAFARLGVGVADAEAGVETVVVALQESRVEIEPFPRELPARGAHRLRGRVLAPFSMPRVYVTRQAGEVVEAPTVREAQAFRSEIACGERPGKLKIEVVADDGARSPSVLANFAVWCGVAAPRSMALGAPEPVPEDAAEVERALLEMTNRDRQAAGLPPLQPDAHAAAIARSHSAEMRDRGVLAHVSPTTGSAADRARAGGLATPLVLENLARAYSATEAHRGLMASPGHRANLMSPQATHLGIGVALGDRVGTLREVYVTELFIRRGPRIDLQEARRATAEALAAARARAGVPAARGDARLDRIAQAYAAGLAAGQPDPILAARADGELDRLTNDFKQVVTVIAVATEVAQAIGEPALDPRVRVVGVGVGQGNHRELGEGALYVVLLLARPR